MPKSIVQDQESTPSASLRSHFKFRLRHLIYATALIAAGLALSPSTIWFSMLVLLGWWVVFFCSRPKTVLGFILLVLIIVVALMPTVSGIIRESPYHTACSNNLRQISLAILYYESEYGRFPTDRVVTLADGTKLRHSWQVEILPYLMEQRLYDQYDFNEPWNGPNNSKLESQMPSYLACPACDTGTKTPYRLVNGPGTAFEVGKNLGAADIEDGTFYTISLIEDHANPKHWMEPGDFTAEEAVQVMNQMTENASSHFHDDFFTHTYFGSSLAMLNGSTHWWPTQRDQPMQPGAFLINDGYLFDLNVQGQPYRKIKYGMVFAVGSYLLLIFLPAFYLKQTSANQVA
ncbi:DUF1559 domain-containing protein [Mariniblastus sp.]|nr:DUF1559 domain-containing protein [Mariniblastus sp.]